MRGEVTMDSWFSSLWRNSRKSIAVEPEKAVIGILAFEVANLMSKVVNLWQCVSDTQIARLREEIRNSIGIQKLVSDDEDYLMDLALSEIVDNLGYVAKSVVRLGMRCVSPIYHHLEKTFEDTVQIELKWSGWRYRLKKMERKIKKMEKFVAVTAQLYQESEVLAELEQSLRRMQANDGTDKVKLLEFQQKVMCQRQEVKNLREMSPWVRSYDYTVRLLLRSVFTIIERIKYVFVIDQIGTAEEKNESHCISSQGLDRSPSMSAVMQYFVHPSDDDISAFRKGPVRRSVSSLGLGTGKNRSHNKKPHPRHHSTILSGEHLQKTNRGLVHGGIFKGCMLAASDSPVPPSFRSSTNRPLRSNEEFEEETHKINKTCMVRPFCRGTVRTKMSLFICKHKLSDAPPSTLGGASLALQYANVITLIEKLVSRPDFVSLDARDDLYNMLPASVKNSLRSKLKVFSKTLASSVYDPALAAEWSLALTNILDWLAPLAHNMIRWHSERNFEKQRMDSGTNVLLIQTLYYANQAKTEAAITELLMGLNYLSRFGRQVHEKVFVEPSYACDDYLVRKYDTVSV